MTAKSCPICKADYYGNADRCPDCAGKSTSNLTVHRLDRTVNYPREQSKVHQYSHKRVLIAGGLSFIVCVPGLGQLYNRQWIKALLVFLIICGWVYFMSFSLTLYMFWIVLAVMASADAMVSASKRELGLELHPLRFF